MMIRSERRQAGVWLFERVRTVYAPGSVESSAISLAQWGAVVVGCVSVASHRLRTKVVDAIHASRSKYGVKLPIGKPSARVSLEHTTGDTGSRQD